MENENKKTTFLEVLKVNAINIVAITLSVVAIILSIIAINGNVYRRGFGARRIKVAYENRMAGQDFNQQPNRTFNSQDGNTQGPKYFAGPNRPSACQNRSGKNRSGQRSTRRITPNRQNETGTQVSPNMQQQKGPGTQESMASSGQQNNVPNGNQQSVY